MDDLYSDDLFDDVDDAELEALERPTKRQKSSHPDGAPQGSDDSPRNPAHLALAERLLKGKFGYESFRYEQAGAIQSILGGENALVIFPTGAGKSLCYQIPGIAFPELDRTDGTRSAENGGITIVVSPLLALMKDQVDQLKKRGIAADSIDSTKSWEQMQLIYASMRKSQLRILYVAPERLNNEGFVETIKGVPGGIRLLAVDEAHCVSEWGHSFRPDYLKVARFGQEINAERIICLTATATEKVAEDIASAFKIKESCIFRTSPYRPNLQLHAKTISAEVTNAAYCIELMFGKAAKTENDRRFEELFEFVRRSPGPTLVYVALQQQAEAHAEALTRKGFSAAAFHAGMKTEVKKQVQEDFMSGKIRIVCATIAFGMGIDKADIRNVVHWDLANSVEEYSQQIGRAGRDGKPSNCVFYLAPSAFYLRQVFARGDVPSWNSIKRLVTDIAFHARGLPVGGIFSVSQYSQGKDFDFRPSPLSVIYATLELTFGLIRAITPEYATYKYEATDKYYHATQDSSPEAKAIFSNAKKKAKLHDIDVLAAARESGLDRLAIVRKLNEFNARGSIKLQTAGVKNRYVLLKQFPQQAKQIDDIVAKLYADQLSKEQDALQRGRAVMDLITGSKCFALGLAQHFGMGLPDGKTKCGHCTYCLTGNPVRGPPKPKTGAVTARTIQDVLKATNVRDDPRFLARVAYGISSPRVTSLKLGNHAVFRSLAEYDFDDLLREFTKACGGAQ